MESLQALMTVRWHAVLEGAHHGMAALEMLLITPCLGVMHRRIEWHALGQGPCAGLLSNLRNTHEISKQQKCPSFGPTSMIRWDTQVGNIEACQSPLSRTRLAAAGEVMLHR